MLILLLYLIFVIPQSCSNYNDDNKLNFLLLKEKSNSTKENKIIPQTDCDIKISIIQDNISIDEYKINTPHLFFKDYIFHYNGKPLILENNTKISGNLTNINEKIDEKIVFFTNSSHILNYYFGKNHNNQNLRILLNKVIIFPDNVSPKEVIDKKSSSKQKIYLLAINERLYNIIYNNLFTNNNFKINITSPKYDQFPFKKMFILLFVFFIIFIICLLITMRNIKNVRRNLITYKFISNFILIILFKILIITLLIIEIYDIKNSADGLILPKNSIISIFLIVLIPLFKYQFIHLSFQAMNGVFVFIKKDNDKMIHRKGVLISLIYSVFFLIFSSQPHPEKLTYVPHLCFITFFLYIFVYQSRFSISNIIHLRKIYFFLKNQKCKQFIEANKKKLIIIICQFILYIFYILGMVILNYIQFKFINKIYVIEREIEFSTLDNAHLLGFWIIYLSGTQSQNFTVNIILEKNTNVKLYKAEIDTKNNIIVMNKDIKKYLYKNKGNRIIILNPRLIERINKNNVDEKEKLSVEDLLIGKLDKNKY